ncbi:MAG: Twitching mobility protein [Elusimicrobia bacterium]|nr:Twitching mobility protein [Elusimicrobiota bacterium]
MATLDILFKQLVRKGGSDLHLYTNGCPVVRIDGHMQTLLDESMISAEQMRTLLMEIAPKSNWDTYIQTGDTDFAYELVGEGRFRCNYFLDSKGMGAVFRLIPSKIRSMQELGLPAVVTEWAKLSKGLIIVTGPTGSGKSTTLAAIIDHINATRLDHIITIEDPIEFVYQNKQCTINQREVKRHTQDFKTALRAALRQDPDVVLVGEMRDLETFEIAMETAETGHLVFATLHTTTAASTIDRIINQFPEGQRDQIRVMLSSTLRGVLAQVLCKNLVKGRTAAMEILSVNPAIANFIREGKTHQIPSSIQTGSKEGMQLMNDALANLVRHQIVSFDEAYLRSSDKSDLQLRLKSA